MINTATQKALDFVKQNIENFMLYEDQESRFVPVLADGFSIFDGVGIMDHSGEQSVSPPRTVLLGQWLGKNYPASLEEMDEINSAELLAELEKWQEDRLSAAGKGDDSDLAE